MESYWDNHKSFWDEHEDNQSEQPLCEEDRLQPRIQQGLLTHDRLHIQKIRSVASDGFDIFDSQGTTVAKVSTTSSLTDRIFTDNCPLIVEDPGGKPVLRIDNSKEFYRDHYHVLYFDESVGDSECSPEWMVDITSKPAIMRKNPTITLLGELEDADVQIKGDFWSHNARFFINDVTMAHISRIKSTLKDILAGNQQYVLQLKEDLSPKQRAAFIGIALTTDVISKKARSS